MVVSTKGNVLLGYGDEGRDDNRQGGLPFQAGVLSHAAGGGLSLRFGSTVGSRNAVFWYPFITSLKADQQPPLGLTFSQIRWQRMKFIT